MQVQCGTLAAACAGDSTKFDMHRARANRYLSDYHRQQDHMYVAATFGLALQTMYSFPLRLTTLQESQSFLMAERTRMALQALCNSDVHPSYFAADDPSRGRC